MKVRAIIESNKRDKQVLFLVKRQGKSGVIYYAFVKQINHKRYNKVIGNSNNMTIAQARLKANQMYLDISSGKHKDLLDITIEEAVPTFAFPYWELKSNSKLYFRVWNNYILPVLGRCKVKDISYIQAQNIVNDLVQQGYQPETIRKYVLVFKSLFLIFIRCELAFYNPFNQVERPQVSNVVKLSMTLEESKAFVAICTELDTVFSRCLALMLFTGLRVSEAISIESANISNDFKTLTLIKTKSGVSQQISLSSFASSILERSMRMTHNVYAFPSPIKLASHISAPRGSMEVIKKLMFERGHDISRINMHALRKTFATVCAEITSGDMMMVASQIRHASPSILNRYVNYQPETVAQVSEKVAQTFLAKTHSNTGEHL